MFHFSDIDPVQFLGDELHGKDGKDQKKSLIEQIPTNQKRKLRKPKQHRGKSDMDKYDGIFF